MFEKRKNSQKRTGISLFFAIAFLIAGIYMGLSINERDNDEAVAIQEVQRTVDLSGEWIGTTTQDYDTDSHYDYRIVIEQDNAGNITGMSYLDMINDYEIYAEERIEGSVDGTSVIYSEVETLVLDNTTLDQWCLTETTLSYQMVNGQETLIGSWEYVLGEDPACEGISGRVILTRQVD